jgi:hypothetical protein
MNAEQGGTTAFVPSKSLSTRALTPGSVVWARIDFDDRTGFKVRPCMVLRCLDAWTVVLMPFTSGPKDWAAMSSPEAAGVEEGSGFEGFTQVVERTSLYSRSGTVTADDLALGERLAVICERSHRGRVNADVPAGLGYAA